MRAALSAGFALVLALSAAACVPALNWREVQLPQSTARALFPCRPEFSERAAAAGQGSMGLAQCKAAGLSFSLAWAEAGEPSQVAAALRAMPEALAAKLGVPLTRGLTVQVPGMTPHGESAQHRLATASAAARIAVFAHGATVYQAVLLGPADDPVAWEGFLGGLRVGSATAAAR